jgi:hypothetical protein
MDGSNEQPFWTEKAKAIVEKKKSRSMHGSAEPECDRSGFVRWALVQICNEYHLEFAMVPLGIV